jgi:isocitrate dehydrogenase kinase/phosphatase
MTARVAWSMPRNFAGCVSHARFAPELLEELERETAQTVHVDGADLVFNHMYIERRMTPLNLYLRSAAPEAAEHAVLDYGQCIRDLAYTNIFPGDLLLKNFGVTRHGRVIFYDYDELCQVTDCTFRDVPRPPTRRTRCRPGSTSERPTYSRNLRAPRLQ